MTKHRCSPHHAKRRTWLCGTLQSCVSVCPSAAGQVYPAASLRVLLAGPAARRTPPLK